MLVGFTMLVGVCALFLLLVTEVLEVPPTPVLVPSVAGPGVVATPMPVLAVIGPPVLVPRASVPLVAGPPVVASPALVLLALAAVGVGTAVVPGRLVLVPIVAGAVGAGRPATHAVRSAGGAVGAGGTHRA